MLQTILHHKNKKDLLHLAGLGSVLATLFFAAIVSFVIYQALHTALFESEQSSAQQLLQIKDEELRQAIKFAQEWEKSSKTSTATNSSKTTKTENKK